MSGSTVFAEAIPSGATTLQEAYDADTTAPHITPLLSEGFEIAGRVDVDGPLEQGNLNAMVFSETYTQSAAFVGGCILSNGTITYANSTWIWALLQESKAYVANVGAGFAAFTLFNALATITNGLNANLVQALILNNGVSHRSTGAVAVTTSQTIGLSNAPNTRALAAFGSMTKTIGDTAVRHAPTFGTVNLSTINFGTQRGLHMINPTFGLFQPSAGIEQITAYIGVDVDAIPFGGNITKRALRSNLAAATNTRAIECAGTAESDFGGPVNFPNDFPNGVIRMGASNDFSMGYLGATDDLYMQIVTPNVTQWRFSAPGTNRLLIENSTFADSELNLNYDKFSLGAQSGANGNQVGNFVTPARTIGVAGEWADFLLTQAGSLTVDGNSMSRVSAWVINGVSYASSSGTVTEADTLTVGGFPTSSPGVTITDRQSLHVIGGRSRFDSNLQFEPINPSALGAGDNNNWGGLLTGSANNNMREWARITGNATTSVITGIDSGAAQDGDAFTLTNVGSETILLAHQDTASTDVNRIITPDGNNYVLSENRSANIRYDATTERWRVITAPAAVAPLSGEWQFDSTTTMADPGNGSFRVNNATIGSVTAIAISDETKPGNDAGNILAAVASGDQIYIQNLEDGSEFLVFDVTSNTDNTGWHQIGGTVNASGSNFTDGKEFIVTVLFA